MHDKSVTVGEHLEIFYVLKEGYPIFPGHFASCLLVDFPPGTTLRCKPLPSGMFSETRLYFFDEIMYNGASDKSAFGGMELSKS